MKTELKNFYGLVRQTRDQGRALDEMLKVTLLVRKVPHYGKKIVGGVI